MSIHIFSLFQKKKKLKCKKSVFSFTFSFFVYFDCSNGCLLKNYETWRCNGLRNPFCGFQTWSECNCIRGYHHKRQSSPYYDAIRSRALSAFQHICLLWSDLTGTVMQEKRTKIVFRLCIKRQIILHTCVLCKFINFNRCWCWNPVAVRWLPPLDLLISAFTASCKLFSLDLKVKSLNRCQFCQNSHQLSRFCWLGFPINDCMKLKAFLNDCCHQTKWKLKKSQKTQVSDQFFYFLFCFEPLLL